MLQGIVCVLSLPPSERRGAGSAPSGGLVEDFTGGV